MSVHRDIPIVWSKRHQFEGTDHPGLRLNNLTTTQRDALTGSGGAKAGDAIYNTTTGLINVYSGSAWLPDGTAGTVTTSATTAALESGSDVDHFTKLTMTAFAIGTSGDSSNLAIGAKFYTFPAGDIVVKDMVIFGKFTAAISVTTDTPEYGVGSTVGTGAVTTLSTTMEDYIDGGAAGGVVGGTAILPNVAGDTFVLKGMLAASTMGVWIKTTGGLSHDLFLNVADGWANVDAAGAVTFTGTITFNWRKVS
jgi:hypothetical protein